MWCLDDNGRDSWDWVGATFVGESMIQLTRVEWRLLACLNGASADCIVIVVVVVLKASWHICHLCPLLANL